MNFTGELRTLAARAKYWREEIAIRSAGRGQVESTSVFFTTQKCASVFFVKLFRFLETRGVRCYNYPGLLWHIYGDRNYDVINALPSSAFQKKDAIFGPFRSFVAIPDLDRRRVALMLRDPRDVLVSEFYSVTSSHSLPSNPIAREDYLARRAEARRASLDAYVLARAKHYKDKYHEYSVAMNTYSNIRLTRYEEYFHDFDRWAPALSESLGLSQIPGVLDYMKGEYLKGRERMSGDPSSHIRNGAPGEHKSALSRNTKKVLNEDLEGILNKFGWNID